MAVIAEFKRKSPSGGELRPGVSPAQMATLYVENGAAALSVLTDETYFGGNDDDLVQARAASGLPVLLSTSVATTVPTATTLLVVPTQARVTGE